MEINVVHRITKLNCNDRNNLSNIVDEFNRKLSNYKNLVNSNLSSYNVSLVNNSIDDVLGDTKVISTCKDGILFYCGLEPSEYEKVSGVSSENVLSREDWINYFTEKFNDFKKYCGNDFQVINAVIHFDEKMPHLQVFGSYRNVSNSVEIDMKRLDNAMHTQFKRLNKKGAFGEVIDYKTERFYYNLVYQEWYDKNVEKYKKKYEIKNQKSVPTYISDNNVFTGFSSYNKLIDAFYENDKNNKYINKFISKIQNNVSDNVEFVKRKRLSHNSKIKNVINLKDNIKIEKEYYKNLVESGKASDNDKLIYQGFLNVDKVIKNKLNMSKLEYENFINSEHLNLYRNLKTLPKKDIVERFDIDLKEYNLKKSKIKEEIQVLNNDKNSLSNEIDKLQQEIVKLKESKIEITEEINLNNEKLSENIEKILGDEINSYKKYYIDRVYDIYSDITSEAHMSYLEPRSSSKNYLVDEYVSIIQNELKLAKFDLNSKINNFKLGLRTLSKLCINCCTIFLNFTYDLLNSRDNQRYK